MEAKQIEKMSKGIVFKFLFRLIAFTKKINLLDGAMADKQNAIYIIISRELIFIRKKTTLLTRALKIAYCSYFHVFLDQCISRSIQT